MWPFIKLKRQMPEMGNCPECQGKISYGHQAYRKRILIPTCEECHRAFDHTFSPASVFSEVQLQRRKRKASLAKECLRESQLSTVKFIRQQYWVVYEITDLVTVYYDSASENYFVDTGDGIHLGVGNIDGLLSWVAASGIIDSL